MRDVSQWKSKIAKDLRIQALGGRGDAQRLCDVELALMMLSTLREGWTRMTSD